MRLDRTRAERALAPLARRLGRSLAVTAAGIVRVANATMERAVRVITVERGHDPREFTLVAFGGAGGLHAADLAAALAIRTVYVPRHPGLLSAWGVLAAEVVRDHGRTLRVVEPSERVLASGFRDLARAARTDLARDGVARPTVEPLLEARYAGQSYEVTVPYGPGWRTAFHRAHERLFGHADVRRPVEVVTLRLRARGGRTSPPPDPPPRRRRRGARAMRPVVFDGGPRPAAVVRRDDLAPGETLRGPAVVCEYSATTVVPPGWRLALDRAGGLVLRAGRV
jgi:N-methylhydantoinase A